MKIYQDDDIFHFSENGGNVADYKNRNIWIMGSISIEAYPIVVLYVTSTLIWHWIGDKPFHVLTMFILAFYISDILIVAEW